MCRVSAATWRLLVALGLWLGATSVTFAQVYPNLNPNTVLGRLGAGLAGPPQQIPLATLAALIGAGVGLQAVDPAGTSYTAQCGQIVSSGSAGGSLAITTPDTATATVNKGCVFAVVISGSKAITVNVNGSQSILLPVGVSGGGGSVTSMPVTGGNGDQVTFTFDPAGGSNLWYISGTAQPTNPFNGNYAYPYNGGSCFTGLTCQGTGETSGHQIPWLDGNNVWQATGSNPEQWLSTNPLMVGDGNSSIPSQSLSGKVFSLDFASPSLAGSPITVSYKAAGSDTVTTVATNVCAAVIANSTLSDPTTGMPFVCDAGQGGGGFNLQWSASIATPTVTSTGTGTIDLASAVNNLDGVFYNFDRRITGYTLQTGDGVECKIDHFNSTVLSQMCDIIKVVSGSDVTSEVTLATLIASVPTRGFEFGDGMLVDYTLGGGIALTFEGQGTINAAVGYYIDNRVAIQWSTANGVEFGGGTGTSYDLSLLNGSGAQVCEIPTGTLKLVCNGQIRAAGPVTLSNASANALQFSNSSGSPDAQIYESSANVLTAQLGATNNEYLMETNAGGLLWDYNVTNANSFTISAPIFHATPLPSGAASTFACWTAGGQLISSGSAC